MTAPARTAAYRALLAITSQASDLPAALANSRRSLADERDRALAAEIVTGALRWLRSLDFLIGRPIGCIASSSSLSESV
jgi:hypothetical protein